jgi:hypothetical protein
LASLAEGKRGEDGMIIYTVKVAAEGITFGWQGLLFCTVKKAVKLFDVPSRNTSLT